MYQITFKAILSFVYRLRFYLFSWAFFGLLIGVIYCFLSPKIYEARFNVALAMVNGHYIPSLDGARRLFANPEDIDAQMLLACNLSNSNADRKKLASSVFSSKFDPEKTLVSVRVRVEGKQAAFDCAMYLSKYMVMKSDALSLAYIDRLKAGGEPISQSRLSSIATNVNVSDDFILPRPYHTISAFILLSIMLGLFLLWLKSQLRSALEK